MGSGLTSLKIFGKEMTGGKKKMRPGSPRYSFADHPLVEA